MEFLDARQTKIAVRKLIRESMSIDLVVAFWGDGAIDELGLSERAGTINIVCNLESGATNPKVISDLEKLAKGNGPRISVGQNDRLHAKIYLFDDAVIIGSSNASTNGLAFEGGELTHWMEANVLSRDLALIKAARDWIGKLDCREISSTDLARAKVAWRKRRSVVRLPRDKSLTVLEAMRIEPSSLAHLPIYLAIYRDPPSPEAARYETSLQQFHSKDVSLFEDWRDLPKKGVLLTFQATKSGFNCDGAWERRGVKEDSTLKNGYPVQIVWKVNEVFGKIPFRQNEKKMWNQICQAAMRKPEVQRGGYLCVPLSEVMAPMPQHPQIEEFRADVWQSISMLESCLKSERGRTVTLGRTRLKIKHVGEVQTVADLVMKKKPSDGFRMLVDRDLTDRTFEALTQKYPSLFDPYVRECAEERLSAAKSG